MSLPVPISLISLAVPKNTEGTIVLAIGKGSGMLEVWICDDLCRKLKSAGSYNAHDQVVYLLSSCILIRVLVGK